MSSSRSDFPCATVAGAGLAGCEAAWQLARRGVRVTLIEMKGLKRTKAHVSDDFAELVCSNSLRSNDLTNAVGLLKEELRRFDSLIMRCADANRVPAGGALAVDRVSYARAVTECIRNEKNIEVVTREVTDFPPGGEVIIATGPLTAGPLAERLKEKCPGSLYFYDAAAPIVTRESIDMDSAFFASRYGKGSADYINCPLNREEYLAFWEALCSAEEAPVHEGIEDFPENPKYFGEIGETREICEGEEGGKAASVGEAENARAAAAAENTGAAAADSKVFEGCMPLEVMARRGEDTLRFGPMKPIGLVDDRTGEHSYAVLQLRRDNAEGSLYNLVGCQTHLRFPEQRRVFAMIPALKNAEFVRYGVMHRNTFLNSPALLDRYYRLRSEPRITFAGQMTGVEGYVESCASGLLAGIETARRLYGKAPLDFPKETAVGALSLYVSQGSVGTFQPMNINFGIIAPLDHRVKGKRNKNAEISRRALEITDRLKERDAQ